jgi:hypothetical protein
MKKPDSSQRQLVQTWISVSVVPAGKGDSKTTVKAGSGAARGVHVVRGVGVGVGVGLGLDFCLALVLEVEG